MIPTDAQQRADMFVALTLPVMTEVKTAEVKNTAHRHTFPVSSTGAAHCAFCGEKAR